MLSTGQACDQAGAYRSICCKQDVAGRRATVLPICPRCLRETQWVIVFPAMGAVDDNLHAAAAGLAEEA